VKKAGLRFALAFTFPWLVLPALAQPAERALPAVDIGINQRLNERIPLDLTFRNEAGEPVTLQEFFGAKPVILVLAYYRCPRLCSVVLNNLMESLQQVDFEIGKEFAIVTVSIDPRETPELAAAKKEAHVAHYGRPSAITGWHFLTGEEKAIEQLAESVGFSYRYDSERDVFDHASGILILTPDGTIARYFYGVDFSPRDLRFALEDASAGKIGSPIARSLRLLCFAYDPASGKYTLLTMRLVRAGAAAMVLMLGAGWYWAWRRKTSQPEA